MRNTLTGGPNVKAMSASKVHMMQGIQEDTVQTISSTQKVLRQQIFAAVIKSKCVHIHAQNSNCYLLVRPRSGKWIREN